MEWIQPYLTSSFVREILLWLHLLAVVAGMGGVLFTQYYFFKVVRHCVDANHLIIYAIIVKVVRSALFVMFLTGISFFILYYFASPEKIYNTKVFAKLIVISILIFNGSLLHNKALKVLVLNIGKPFIHNLSLDEIRYFLYRGSLSFIFWNVAFFMGVLRTLNGLYSLQFYLILIVCLLVLIKAVTYLIAPYYVEKPQTETFEIQQVAQNE